MATERWSTRGYLPHFEGGGHAQFLTIRLVDSLPAEILEGLEREIAAMPRALYQDERRRRLEAYLDQGAGDCWLARPAVATMVASAIQYLDGRKYDLHAWVVMPNHVHVLFSPCESVALAQVAHSLKSFTAKEANRLLGRTGPFWQREYFDRAVRDESQFRQACGYIEANPVKAGLCQRVADWPYRGAAWD